MRVREAMSTEILSVGPAHKLRQVAQQMSARRFGAAIVDDADTSGFGIITERDILNALAAGLDPDVAEAGEHYTPDAICAGPDMELTEASRIMIRGGFRHLIVIEHDQVVGMISVRDIVRARVEHPVDA
ncbi:CBS domain-containing protein [Longispora sp. K20-0274]|uniref:CBS domain-containing protein n=1 Tax=Longispora sp. K20-0274 TaxID=3088255 RepID=UPI00399A08DD